MADEMSVPPEAAHFEKYERISRILGIKSLSRLVTTSIDPECIKSSLDRGDKWLNDIPLRRWDSLANSPIFHRVHPLPPSPSWNASMSLAERVCTLKHVARYYIAGVDAPDGCAKPEV